RTGSLRRIEGRFTGLSIIGIEADGHPNRPAGGAQTTANRRGATPPPELFFHARGTARPHLTRVGKERDLEAVRNEGAGHAELEVRDRDAVTADRLNARRKGRLG